MAKKRKQPGNGSKLPAKREGYVHKIVPKAISRTRSDIDTWKRALRAADNVDTPRRAQLNNLYRDILLDAHLCALIELRMQTALSSPPVIKRGGERDDELTDMIRKKQWVQDLCRSAWDTLMYGYTLIEIDINDNGDPVVTVIPRNNVVPEQGLLLLKEDDSKGILYREVREYGWWLLEFGDNKSYGLLNKAIPHVLFKRFAQACWSELCEIYAIPPRYIKTDTTDPVMLDRAEQMLKDMGSAAYFIIDTTEVFEFAKGVATNGDVYNNLITLCKQELSLLTCGAIIGQDTKFGNESKEKSSQQLFDKIIQSDKRLIETAWNDTVIPALARIGILPPDASFEFEPEEDLEKLWKMTTESMPYMEIDPDWIKDKFGIEVTGAKSSNPGQATLQIDTSGFFD